MSAVMSDQPSNNVAEFFAPGPGERLRAARLSMGFDLAKIASELHLTGRVVEALEADEYQGIGARVFVRGYLRNYARIVGMPVESILRQFDEKWPDDGARQSMLRQSPTLPADGGPSRGWAGAITWLLAIGLVVLFLMWWRGYLDGIVPEQIRTTAGTEVGAGVRTLEAQDPMLNPAMSEEPVMADGSLRLPAPPPDVDPALEGGAENSIDAASGSVDTTADSTGLPAPAEQAEAAETAPEAAVSQAAASPALSLTSLNPAPADDGGAPVVEGTQQIVLTFGSPCWVDVRDSERKFKLFGEMPKGTRKVLGGKPPYKLVIGNAHAVSITVNGKPFDLLPYAKGNVARFTLNP